MSTPDPNVDLERDNEWAQLGDELEWGTELLVEWGVRISLPDRSYVSIYGTGASDETAARMFVVNLAPRDDRTAEVVARRVLYGPWGERNAD